MAVASRSPLTPDRMNVVEASGPGGPEMLAPASRPVPTPGPGEVLIAVAAAGVNRPDLLQREGRYPPPPGASDLLGLEVSGIVAALGDGVDSLSVGQPVCALLAGGGYAEYAVAPAGQCLTVPESLSLAEAAALPETLFTVWSNLFQRGFAREGETVLVHGGTSGIGTMAIALCRLFGIRILVTCGSDGKCSRAKALGADGAINYRTSDFVAEVDRLTEAGGVNVVLDMVGGDYVPRNLACLAEEGRHVSISVQRGKEAAIDLFYVMRRRLILTGSLLRPRTAEYKSMLADDIARNVWPAVEEGQLKPVVDTCFALRRAADAHARMEAGDHVGKIVLLTESG